MTTKSNIFHNQIGLQLEMKQVKDLAPRTINGGYTTRPVVLSVKVHVYRNGSLFIYVDDENQDVKFRRKNVQDFFNNKNIDLKHAQNYVISIVESIYHAELLCSQAGEVVPDEYFVTVRSGEGLFEHKLAVKRSNS